LAGSRDTSKEMTGWDVSSWDRAGKSEEGQAAARGKRTAAQQCFLQVVGKTAVLDDTSMEEQVEAAAVALQEAMVGTLDEHARKKRWCSRSKLWWTEDIAVLRKEFGRERRRPAGIGQVQGARQDLRRALRKTKWEWWHRFLQEAEGSNVWTAASYTTPKIDKAGQTLVAEDGSIAESQEECEQAIMRAYFPKAPPGSFEPREGGKAFERVGAHLVGSLLAKAVLGSQENGHCVRFF